MQLHRQLETSTPSSCSSVIKMQQSSPWATFTFEGVQGVSQKNPQWCLNNPHYLGLRLIVQRHPHILNRTDSSPWNYQSNYLHTHVNGKLKRTIVKNQPWPVATMTSWPQHPITSVYRRFHKPKVRKRNSGDWNSIRARVKKKNKKECNKGKRMQEF